ncbi:hypothetical protein VCJ_000595 [Vibrio metoecus]|nr:hypothetical protein VCJ_000595 [Vibrio metoecus]
MTGEGVVVRVDQTFMKWGQRWLDAFFKGIVGGVTAGDKSREQAKPNAAFGVWCEQGK